VALGTPGWVQKITTCENMAATIRSGMVTAQAFGQNMGLRVSDARRIIQTPAGLSLRRIILWLKRKQRRQ